MEIDNPFLVSGYAGPEYFCDRKEETARLVSAAKGKVNTLLISRRRMGKSGLIEHLFANKEIAKKYYTFYIDIYSTLDLNDFVWTFGNVVCKSLMSKGSKIVESFMRTVKSIQFRMGYDEQGLPSTSFGLGEIRDKSVSLDEIFNYIETADRPCIVAFDEFQQIAKYPEKNLEALLRTYIQKSKNAVYIFSGSQRHIIQNMFASPSRPFYNSTVTLSLESINKDKYIDFVVKKFKEAGKSISKDIVSRVYDMYEGHTWYIQFMFHEMYYMAQPECSEEMIDKALDKILKENESYYSFTLYNIPDKQQNLLRAIAAEGMADRTQSAEFVKKYNLQSASSVQSATQRLMERDIISCEKGVYFISDRFFATWLKRKFKF